MSYTFRIKDEIFSKEIGHYDEKLAEIYGILYSKNAFYEKKIEITLENYPLSERVVELFTELTELKTFIKYSISKKLGEHKVYVVTIPYQNGYNKFLDSFRLIEEQLDEREDLYNGFLRGLFLACGYIKDPEKEYAIDFFIDSEEVADKLYLLLKFRGKRCFKTTKRNKFLIYLRNSEDIMDVLVAVGILKEFFKYEETIMLKEIKNKTIREINWEVANETKTLNTGRKHVLMIEYIDGEIGLSSMTTVLQEMAMLRLQNPEFSLHELGDLINLSKSGVRNRFRRIEKIYNDLKEQEEK
ncbi:DNA-binding protein WhiA [Psychrilyobacter sp.]|uniref:DNA-binding protein WhiA n=1 Tax=Psychrilyobacter sp. TaxID=2586924 RepID=UPI0030172B1E